jgi:hypothetical protein
MTDGLREWSTSKLRHGDLTALHDLVAGSRAEESRLKRLARRGFIAQRKSGQFAVTARGRVALLVRRLSQ